MKKFALLIDYGFYLGNALFFLYQGWFGRPDDITVFHITYLALAILFWDRFADRVQKHENVG